MKKIIFILMAFVLFVHSCREDGEWENENSGQYGFLIERDNDFIEKGIGETNHLKLNIIPNYNFNSILTKFKFSTNLNGVLKLNGQILSANHEYTFSNKENIFEYIGNVAGTHQVKFIIRNDKGASKEENFDLKYSVSEFTLSTTSITGDIYQGEEVNYIHKIIPVSGQPNTGYQIRFDSYSGEIKFNGVTASLGQYYSINNIDNFIVSLNTAQAGQGKLNYTIKNPTVEKVYEIQQTILARQIVIESMNVNSLHVIANTQMSLVGIIRKTPSNSNSTIKYKTWLSSSSNNNLSGIQTTNNVYTPYALGSNGSFNINFNAVDNGNYTLNIQAEDEFGNQSSIKSFDIAVQAPIWFEGGQAMRANIRIIHGFYTSINFISFDKTFKALAGGNASITTLKYTVTLQSTSGTKIEEYTETYTGGNVVDYSNVSHNAENRVLWNAVPSGFLLNTVTIKVEAINSNNQSAFIIIPATITTV